LIVEEGEHISTAVTYWELIYTEKLARSYRYSIHFILMRKRIECDECWFILVRDNGNWRKEGGAKEISQPRSASRLAPIRKRPPQLQSSFSLSLSTLLSTKSMISSIFKYGSISAAVLVGLYAVIIGLLTTPTFQAHVVYLHKIQMTWFKDLNVPETFGFLKNQVTPFYLETFEGHR
jgi:hypothetical protein